MKKILILILAIGMALPSCKKDEIATYDATDFIYFGNRIDVQTVYWDTLKSFNFFFEPGVDETTINLKVSRGGVIADEDKEFLIDVEVYSGTEGADFEVDRTQIMPAGASAMNIPVKIFRTNAIAELPGQIKITLLPNENFSLSLPEVYKDGDTIQCTTMYVQFMDLLTAPPQWERRETYIGYFSPAKYYAFNELFGLTIDDWTDTSSRFLLNFNNFVISFVNHLNSLVAKGPEYALKDPDAKSNRGYMYVEGYEWYGTVMVPPVIIPEEFPTTPDWQGEE